MRFALLPTVTTVLVASMVLLSCNDGNSPNKLPETDAIVLNFLSTEEAAAFLSTSDSFTRNQLSKITLKAFMGDENATEADYLAFAAKQALEWTDEEKAAMLEAADSLNSAIRKKGLRLDLPDTIDFIKTTCAEAGGSGGYTREKTIVINRNFFGRPREMFKQFVAHEIFHILTRHTPLLRSELYSLIGFDILPEEIHLPDEIRACIIANPDVSRHDSYACLTVNGEPRTCAMLLYYDGEVLPGGGLTAEMMTGRLIEINPETREAVRNEDGSCRIYHIDEAEDFRDKVGYNTDYVPDPEEALADNFMYMLTADRASMPTPELLEQIETALK